MTETSISHEHGCAVCNPALREDPNKVRAERTEIAEHDIVLVEGGGKWTLLDLHHRHVEDDKIPLPSIVYSGLYTREAAETARVDAIANMLDHDAPFGSSQVSVEHFNLVGRLMRFFFLAHLDDVVKDPRKVARELAFSKPWEGRPASMYDEIPF